MTMRHGACRCATIILWRITVLHSKFSTQRRGYSSFSETGSSIPVWLHQKKCDRDYSKTKPSNGGKRLVERWSTHQSVFRIKSFTMKKSPDSWFCHELGGPLTCVTVDSPNRNIEEHITNATSGFLGRSFGRLSRTAVSNVSKAPNWKQ